MSPRVQAAIVSGWPSGRRLIAAGVEPVDPDHRVQGAGHGRGRRHGDALALQLLDLRDRGPDHEAFAGRHHLGRAEDLDRQPAAEPATIGALPKIARSSRPAASICSASPPDGNGNHSTRVPARPRTRRHACRSPRPGGPSDGRFGPGRAFHPAGRRRGPAEQGSRAHPRRAPARRGGTGLRDRASSVAALAVRARPSVRPLLAGGAGGNRTADAPPADVSFPYTRSIPLRDGAVRQRTARSSGGYSVTRQPIRSTGSTVHIERARLNARLFAP